MLPASSPSSRSVPVVLGPRFSPRALGITAAVITVIVWTAFIVVARASASRSLTPLDLVFARLCGACVVLMPWGAWLVLKARRDRPRGERGSDDSMFGLAPLPLRLTALAGISAGLGYALLAYSGFFFAPAVHASVLLPGSLPLWTALLAAWVLRDRITPIRALGLALIVGGDLLVGGHSLLQAFEGGSVWRGDLMFIAAAFSWSCFGVLARRHRLDAVRVTSALTVFAFFTFVPVYVVLVAGGWIDSHIGRAPWGEVVFQMAFQGIVSVVISGIGFTRMVEYFGPVRTTMITALVPGLSALGAVLFLDEPLFWNVIAGLLLVTAGILFGVQRSAVRPAAAASPKPEHTGLAGRIDG